MLKNALSEVFAFVVTVLRFPVIGLVTNVVKLSGWASVLSS